MIPLDTHTFKHETHLPICFIKATEETRQLDLKPSKDYCPLSISNQVYQTELECVEFDIDTKVNRCYFRVPRKIK
ncbi:uncharacterized protein LOC111643666 isoform X2 [Copidosoma floridanum]|uniref:uncharacterized protein LOC111643666 isoform X2 n=1 Tax=Copidosoma floridanum TaxID=29053 RepID=UPI000C6F6732|nr:uncharacterized protein LOC111643666 isoform X2 [Copidosoma floridanum]